MTKDQELEEKLKPCPHCGGVVELHGRGNGWTIECYNCNVSMNMVDMPSVIIKQWNCREHDMKMAIEAVESTSHKPASCLTSTKLKILNEAISAIRERFSDG